MTPQPRVADTRATSYVRRACVGLSVVAAAVYLVALPLENSETGVYDINHAPTHDQVGRDLGAS
jgi:hypothetical protein